MAEKYRFFDAAEENGIYDREYNAQEFTDYFKTIITTGVMKGALNELKVSTPGTNMTTMIDTGIAFIEGRYYENDSTLTLVHETESTGADRIDRIVLRMDTKPESRHLKAFIKKGVPNTSPVAPELTKTANVYEISLAQVYIVGGGTFISSAHVTDERGKVDICPWASSNILPSYDSNDFEKLKADTEGLVKKVNTDSTALTIYVDGVLGSDLEGQGLSEGSGAYRTINYAIEQIKKLSVGGYIFFKVAPGYYDEDVRIQDFNGYRVVRLQNNGGPVEIKTLGITYSEFVDVRDIKVKGTIFISNVREFYLLNITRTGNLLGDGIRIIKSTGEISGSEFSNVYASPNAAVEVNDCSSVILRNVSGTSNNIGIQASASHVFKYNSTITGTTVQKLEQGAQIWQ